MNAPRLLLFGAPAIEQGGAATPLAFERRHQLACVLAGRRDWVGRAELAALLWPEHERALAAANLRKTLFRLQQQPWVAALETRANALRLALPTDTQDFDAALAAGRVADALALRRGEWLQGFDDDANEPWTTWLRFERDRLRAAWRDAALARLAGEGLDNGAVVELAKRLLEVDPLDEAALRALMHALAASGQDLRARQAYREFAERLRDELSLAPGPETQALHDSLAGEGAVAVAPSPTLPTPLDAVSSEPGDPSFIGRRAERRALAELLTLDEPRWITLTGPGGIGKTRLARQVLREQAGGFDDGAARFVALEDAASAHDAAARIASAAGIALRGGGAAPMTQLQAALRERAWLLVLDNLEAFAGQAEMLRSLDALMAACPRLKVVATSRVRLGLAAEQLLPLDGLPCPEAEDHEHLDSFDAARLFVSAARRVRPGFRAEAQASAIVDICRQVEGLPLALELAAAWTRVLSCEAIAAELGQGSELLRASDAARVARHASIEQVFEQSWRHLVDAEREALARLSVFRGSFSAEAARAVTGAALPVLAALIDKSLLRRDSGTGERLSLHPLLHQFAAARFRADRDAGVRDRHASWFGQQLEALRAACEAGERQALAVVEADFENHRQAWAHAAALGQREALLRAVPALLDYFEHRARFDDGLSLLRIALDAPAVMADAVLHARLTAHAALLDERLGRYDAARAGAERALAVARARRDRVTKFEALKVLGGCAVFNGRVDEARDHLRTVLEMARADGLNNDVAAALDNLSLAEKRLGHYEQALRLAEEALAQHRRNANPARTALCLSNLASLAMFMDDTASAATYLREALALSERQGLTSTRAFALANLTELALKAGDREGARGHAERALEVARAQGMRMLAGWLEAQLSRLAAARGEGGLASEYLAAAAALALELQAPSVQAAVLLAFAELLEARGEPALARRALAFAADEPTLSAPDRDELRVEWARRVAEGAADAPWPAIMLPALLERLVTEAAQGHAALIAELQPR